MVYGNQNSAPDAEVTFRAWAINRTPITNICGTRIATRLPRNATLPFLVFFRGGGLPVSPRSQVLIEEAIIPISCFAGSILPILISLGSVCNTLTAFKSEIFVVFFNFSIESRISP